MVVPARDLTCGLLGEVHGWQGLLQLMGLAVWLGGMQVQVRHVHPQVAESRQPAAC